MRGYFGIGVEGISKEQNVGTIVRSTHSFGGSFFFTIQPDVDIKALRSSDTSDAFNHMPYYQYANPDELALPEDCTLVGIELTDESIVMPSFRHPLRAAYVFGPEMGSLSKETLKHCDHVVKIPMKFCVNVGVAAAITMYDRMICLGRFAERPVRPGGPIKRGKKPKPHNHRRKTRKKI
ncbi:MAG: RNA methyltransferase [Alphaproteobacteria bacterium]|nr:RNA methyltransferase [Alphaproteobacteria bacterium]